jgi:hypothetical protein
MLHGNEVAETDAETLDAASAAAPLLLLLCAMTAIQQAVNVCVVLRGAESS